MTTETVTLGRLLADAAGETDIVKRNRAVQAAVKRIDTSRTDPTTADRLVPGDIITTLGAVTFPFPFVLTSVTEVTHGGHSFGYQLKAAHGWFTPGPVKATERTTRVI